jgi:hypothetical protein
MLNTLGCSNIPDVLLQCITFLVGALPLKSVPTFIELLFGAMLTEAGFVTQAYLALPMKRHWTTYYKWLQKGKWSWVALGLQVAKMLVRFFPQTIWHLVIDDTHVLRTSKKAPGSKIYREHSKKPNRPEFVRAQNWVNLAAVVINGIQEAAVPILSRLMREVGNASKLDAAKTLLKVIAPVFAGLSVRLLMDSWYMRGNLLAYALLLGFNVIGQVRKDTALYMVPTKTGKRGRPRKYGEKYTPEMIKKLPAIWIKLFVYGKMRWVRYRSVAAQARFLKGRMVIAVWSSIEDDKGRMPEERLIIATDLTLSATDVIWTYARRYPIESMFNQAKNQWGWKETWQQSRQVLHRWFHILGIGYALPQLLAIKGGEKVKRLASIAPWRDRQPITAGRVRSGLVRIFGHFPIRAWWDAKSRKFGPPDEAEAAASTRKLLKAA